MQQSKVPLAKIYTYIQNYIKTNLIIVYCMNVLKLN